eukprot:Nk52_evm18s1020 gene=Nk52_evmTU18s1020
MCESSHSKEDRESHSLTVDGEDKVQKGVVDLVGPETKEGLATNVAFSTNVIAIMVYIVFERAAYFGFALSMVQYIVDMFEISSSSSNTIIQAFGFLLYGMGAVGSYLADAYLGRWKVCLYGGIMYLVGLALAFVSSLPFLWDDFPDTAGVAPLALFFAALVLVVVGGSGKMIYSVMLADQVAADTNDPKTIERVFLWYTAAINGGPCISMYLVPYLHTFGKEKTYGDQQNGTSYYFSYIASFAFLFSGSVFFYIRRNYYVNAGPPTNGAVSKSVSAISSAYRNRRKCPKSDRKGKTFMSFADSQYSENAKDLQSIIHIVWMFLIFITAFQFLYLQMNSSVIIQATWMDSPSWLPAAAIIFFEAISSIFWSYVIDFLLGILRKHGIAPGLHLRNFVGMLVAVICFLYLAGLQHYIEQNGSYSYDGVFSSTVSIWWQIPGQMLLALSSTIIYASSLEYAVGKSPKHMKNVVMALFSISLAVGSLLSVPMSPAITEDRLMYTYFGLAAGMLVSAVPYLYFYRRYDNIVEEEIVDDAGNDLQEVSILSEIEEKKTASSA